MPEEFFDSQFAARMVRLLQLKRGRGPAFLSDEITPVIDLSRLLTAAPDDTGVQAAIDERSVFLALAGVCFSRMARTSPLPGAGITLLLQVLNPTGSGRIMVIPTNGFVAENATAVAYQLRRYNTPLTALAPHHPLVGLGDRVSVAEIRTQNIANAGVPPAGAGPTLYYHLAGRVAIPLNMPVLLREGQGVIYYPSQATYVQNANEPDPLGNQSSETAISIFEL